MQTAVRVSIEAFNRIMVAIGYVVTVVMLVTGGYDWIRSWEAPVISTWPPVTAIVEIALYAVYLAVLTMLVQGVSYTIVRWTGIFCGVLTIYYDWRLHRVVRNYLPTDEEMRWRPDESPFERHWDIPDFNVGAQIPRKRWGQF